MQIIGKAKIKIQNEKPYTKQLEECIQEAKIYSDSKWLSVTEKYIELQTLWYDRLKSNYYYHWKSCFDDAKIVKVIPVFPDECRIVVHYFCNPLEW